MDGLTLAASACAAAAAVTATARGGASRRLAHVTQRPGKPSSGNAVLAGESLPGLAGQRSPGWPGRSSPVNTNAAAPRKRLAATLAIAGAGYAFVGGVVGAAVGVVLGVVAWLRLGKLEPAAVVRDRERMRTALPLASDLMAAALAAGCPPERAVTSVGDALPGPLGERLRAVAAALRVGTDPAAAWTVLADEPALRPLARAMAGAATRGTSPGPALERIARDSEDVARWTAEARARSVGAKAAVPLGLCFLPAFILVAVVPLIATSLQVLL